MRAIIFILIVAFASCVESESYIPKPRIYPKVNYPEKSFVEYKNNDCPFEMSVPSYMVYLEDSLKNNKESSFNCWFDLYSKDLNAYIHFSYVGFDKRSKFDELVEDAFEMADKHNVKASYRDEIRISYPNKNVYGLLFDIDGPVASPVQFFLTDSTSHFLRGSLYFKGEVNRDSILPVYNFVRSDLPPMFDSFSWTN